MGLIKCPDCYKLFSDRIAACPQCGCPIEAAMQERKKQKSIDKENANISEEILIPIEEPHFIPTRECTLKGKQENAYGEALTQMLWVKGLITLEEKRLIDKRLADKIVEGK